MELIEEAYSNPARDGYEICHLCLSVLCFCVQYKKFRHSGV